MGIENLKFFSSVMKQNKDLGVCCSVSQDWQQNEWLLKEVCQTLSGEDMYVLIEFFEKYSPTPYGICSIVVTEEELGKYFYEDRKVAL